VGNIESVVGDPSRLTPATHNRLLRIPNACPLAPGPSSSSLPARWQLEVLDMERFTTLDGCVGNDDERRGVGHFVGEKNPSGPIRDCKGCIPDDA